ncbi:MAG TPA: cupin domain-containing protein [Gaiellaceae bacterium]|nr:cupin domain-containing protein [Gaiellaceae bacterium]
MPEAGLAPAAAHDVVETEWGRLVWMVSGALGNSETLTVGRCHIHPGRENPRHLHPDCDEVIHVLEGSIEHSCGDERVALEAGDAISIPAGLLHNARNVGDSEAVLLVAFSSATRRTIAEEDAAPA